MFYSIKIAVNLKSHGKKAKIGNLATIIGEGIPQIFNMHFQIWFSSEHVAKFGSVPFSELPE